MKKENEKEEEVEVAKPEGNEPYVLAVTACPTGIAHTYMAADSLKAKAAELGIAIKVETNGSTGIKKRFNERGHWTRNSYNCCGR